jgi:hypothetical protein
MDGFSERNIDIGKPHGFWSETRRILASPSRHLSWSVVLFESSVVSTSLMCSLCETREVINRVRLRTNGTLEIFWENVGQWIGFHGKIYRKAPYWMGKSMVKPVQIFPTNPFSRTILESIILWYCGKLWDNQGQIVAWWTKHVNHPRFWSRV